MSKGQKRIQANKAPIRRCNLEHCANPMYQGFPNVMCPIFINNQNNGKAVFECKYYFEKEEAKNYFLNLFTQEARERGLKKLKEKNQKKDEKTS